MDRSYKMLKNNNILFCLVCGVLVRSIAYIYITKENIIISNGPEHKDPNKNKIKYWVSFGVIGPVHCL